MSGIKAIIPTMISGAVSPMACAKAMIAPVSIPGIAKGNTWSRTICHLVSPRANPA